MRKSRTIESLSEHDYRELKLMIKRSEKPAVRSRAHAVILNAKGYCIDDLSDIFEVDRDTVSAWLTRWECDRFDGLLDEGRPGRPPIANDVQKKEIVKLVDDNPRSLKAILQDVKKN